MENNKVIIKILKKSFVSLLLVIILTGCSSKNGNKKINLKDGAIFDFENKYTLLQPEEEGTITKNDFIKGKKDNYADWMMAEKMRAGIEYKDIDNWKYVSTDVNFFSLNYLTSDMLGEKNVAFVDKNNADNWRFLSATYYYDSDNWDWVILKNVYSTINKKDGNLSNLKTSKETIWNCGFGYTSEQCEK